MYYVTYMCRNMMVCFVVVKHNGLNINFLTIDVSYAGVWSFTCGRIAWNVRGELL